MSASVPFGMNTAFSGRDPGTTQRLPSSSLFTVSSRDRFENYPEGRGKYVGSEGVNSDPYNFTINRASTALMGYMTRIAVSEVSFDWSAIPNINRKTDAIYVNYRVGVGALNTELIEINPGFYRPSQLASTLQAKVRALDPDLSGFVMTYGVASSITGAGASELPLFQYSTPGSPDVSVWWSPLPYDSPVYRFPPSTKQLFDLLGFTEQNSTEAFALTYIEPLRSAITYCQFTQYIDIVSPQLVQCQSLRDSTTQAIAHTSLCRLYLADSGMSPGGTSCASSTFAPPGTVPTVLYKDYSNVKQIQWIPTIPVGGSLQFQVYDDAGALLSEVYDPPASLSSFGFNPLFSNRSNWAMTLLASEN